MNKLISVDVEKLTIGIQKILLDMVKEQGISPGSAKFPVKRFEEMVVEGKGISKKEAESITEKVINMGIIRWEIFGNNFVL